MIVLLTILCVILFVACLAELVVLFKDGGRFGEYVDAASKMLCSVGFFQTVRYCSKKIFSWLFSLLRKMFRRFFSFREKNLPVWKIRLAIIVSGGYGDLLVIANWFWYLKTNYIDKTVSVDIVYDAFKSKAVRSIFDEQKLCVRLITKDEYNAEFYSAIIFICGFPVLRFGSPSDLERIAPNFSNYVSKLRVYNKKIEFEVSKHPRLDCLQSVCTMIAGRKRISEPDFDNLLEIAEEYKYPIPYPENEACYLKSVGLERDNFILIHRGWDKSSGTDFNVKAWSLRSCANLIPALKERFPSYKIVLFGAERSQAPSSRGCDLDVVGRTTLDEVKILLKNAVCLVDNEGGMVHLRHALHGGKSVVLFGATSPELFGYSENINIRKDVCKHWCEWITADWTSLCIKSGTVLAPCMEAITTEDVLAAVEKILLKNH